MPSPRDITGDIGRLRNTGVLPDGSAPPKIRPATSRRLSFDPILWLVGLIVFLTLAVEGALTLWMW